MSRFFVAPEQVGSEIITMEDAGDLRHMRKVLRLHPGDEVDISDGQVWEYRACIESLDQDQARLRILDKQRFAAEPLTEVTLYQGIPKQGKMETIIQKCVELGIHRIVPVFTDRTVVVDRGGFTRKTERWQKISAEAVKQCRRGIIPEVSDAIHMPRALEELSDGSYDLVLMPYENEEDRSIKQVLRELAGPSGREEDSRPGGLPKTPPRHIAVFIGPEGGISEAEAEAVAGIGGQSVSLGKTILRTETAGMAALAMIMYELELE